MVSVRDETPLGALLEVCSGRATGQRFPINTQGKVLGSSPSADIQLDDRSLSELHAMVVLRDGAHFVYDLGSETGTFLNQQRVDEAMLRNGDLIQIGQTVLRYTAQPVAPRPVQALAPVAGQYLDQAIIPAPQAPYPMYPPDPRYPLGAPQQGAYPLGASVSRPDDDDEMSLADLLAKARAIWAFFRPYWAWIVAASLIGAVLGLGLYFVKPPPRKATFALALVETLAENPVDGMRATRTNPVEFFRSAELNFKSPTLIEKTLAALGDVDVTQEKVAGVQLRLDFGAVGFNTSTYMGAFTGATGDEALRFLNAHLKLYLDEEIEKTLRVIKGQVEFLEKQLAETERDLRRTEWELLEFKKKNIDGLPDQARQNYELLFDLQKQQAANDREIARLSALKRADRSRLKDEKALVPSRVLATRPYQQSIVDLNRRIAEARARGLGADHPDVIRMRNEVEELTRLAKESVERGEETEVERQMNPVYTSIKDNLRQLEASEQSAYSERERIRKEFQRVRGVVDRLPELETTYAELTRSYDARKQIHQRIFQQLETSRLQVQLERASAAARYDIISPPTLEMASPLKGMVMRLMAGGVAGFLAGLALVAYKRLRHRLRTPPSQPPRIRSLASLR